jgi:general secretion pathway protein E
MKAPSSPVPGAAPAHAAAAAAGAAGGAAAAPAAGGLPAAPPGAGAPPARPHTPRPASSRRPTHHGPINHRLLLTWLVEDGHITAHDRQQVAQRLSGDSALHPLVRLAGAGLVHARSGSAIELDALTQWLARKTGLPHLRIDPLKVDPARVGDVMSASYAEKRHILPVLVGTTEITVATCEPFATEWVAEIESHTRKQIKLVMASPLEIARFTTEFYTLARSVRQAQKTSGDVASSVNFEQLVELGKDKQLDANDQGIVQLVDWLWTYAFEQRASDIHLEPRRDNCAIRFRIDGVLHTVYQVPSTVMGAMTARIKLLGRMDVVERRRPLDGRIKTRNHMGNEVEMRLSTIPTAFGEKLVMRIFDPDTAVKTVEALGFAARDVELWNSLVTRPHGVVLVTGPTGSGKTSTLYATLKKLATDEVNVCTIEDPIEMIEPSFNQTQVQPALELGFAEGLRALMRQDPDIIMVGEIRDLETAEMAIQAALTGHLVFSTLHTNDSPSAITRLVDLGVPPYLINATVIGVLAQRLVRSLCTACKKPDTELKRDTLEAAVHPWRLEGEFKPYRPVGCLDCRNTGFRGRCGLYELLSMTEALQPAVHPVPDLLRIRALGTAEGLQPLRLAGMLKVASGVTTMDEVLRSTPRWEM